MYSTGKGSAATPYHFGSLPMKAADIDFFSDTKTQPSPGMREAIAHAVVGDEQKMEDPTTAALEIRVAKMLRKEAAVFLPSGTMCNEIALRVHCNPGDEVICHDSCHIVIAEAGGPAAMAGVMIKGLASPSGIFTADDVRAAMHPGGVAGLGHFSRRYPPRTGLIHLENTSNAGGGTPWPMDALRSVTDLAQEHGIPTHMDGARLMNGAVALGVDIGEIAQHVDSVWLDFSKGLGAPVGAVLAGSADFIDRAWRLKQQMGGSMRQSGILTAACLYALDHNVARLADDHALAKSVAVRIAGLPGVAEVTEPQTNLLFFVLAEGYPDVNELVDTMREKHNIAIGGGGRRVRVVTHLNVGPQDGDALVAALTAELGGATATAESASVAAARL